MAAYLSKVRVGDTIYSFKDSEVRAAVEVLQTAAASSLRIKGVVTSAAEITGLVNYETGWTYKANSSFEIEGIGRLENGDMIICIADNTAFNAADWSVVQNNTDTMIGANDTTAGTRGLVPAPAANQSDYVLHGDGSWRKASIEWKTF